MNSFYKPKTVITFQANIQMTITIHVKNLETGTVLNLSFIWPAGLYNSHVTETHSHRP